MNRSPLQLKHYHYTCCHLQARDLDLAQLELGDSPYPPMDDIHLQPQVTLSGPEGEENPHDFLLTLALELSEENAHGLPYTFAVEVEGVFQIDHDGPLAERKKCVVVNGGSMLFSVIRELLLTLSARHKFGPILLPSLNFQGLEATEIR